MSKFVPAQKTAAIIPVWKNEEIFEVLKKFNRLYVHKIVIILDEPDSYYITKLQEIDRQILPDIEIITNLKRSGIGNAIFMGLKYLEKNNYKIAIIMAGNGKDNPKEIPKLLNKISEGYDYIQGSRFLDGGNFHGLPFKRLVFNRIWPLFWSLITLRKQTEVTNGFRAYKISILSNPSININQEWLKGYALEYYIHYKIITSRNLKFVEVPVNKIYHKKKDYTRIQPMKHWKQIILTPFLLLFRIKK